MIHSVTLDKAKCRGCTTCVKACPTQAIRVVRGRAVILDGKCIDCGVCVKACPHHAKRVVCDSFARMDDFKYNIVLPSTPLYGQFRNLTDINFVLDALLRIGFDDIFEVSRAAEMLTEYRNRMGGEHPMWKDGPMPKISSACPAVIRLVAMRFPELVPNVMREVSPFELAAIVARREAAEKTGLEPSEIGVCYITPCPAEASRAHNPIGLSAPVVDYVLPMDEVYLKLLPEMAKIDQPRNLCKTGRTGLASARSGGQSDVLDRERIALSVDGIASVIEILDDLEDGKMPEAEFLELDACAQSCFGGCLNVENPSSSKLRMHRMVEKLPEMRNAMDSGDEDYIFWKVPFEASGNEIFSEDLATSLKIISEAAGIRKSLPGLDCGSCGAPSCTAFSEDVASGRGVVDDCIYYMIRKLGRTGNSENLIPVPFRRPIDGGSEDNERKPNDDDCQSADPAP